jgi:hypothetical protein
VEIEEMKIPKHIDVKGVRYKIKIEPDIKNKAGEDLDGYTCSEKKIIAINSALKNGMDLDNTYIHEVFHAHIDEMHLREVIKDGVEEIIAQTLSRFITDNYYLVPRKKKTK